MKRIMGLFMILSLFIIPINTYAEDVNVENKQVEEKDDKEEVKKVKSEKVEFVQCDDSKSAKFRNSDNELLSIKLLGITVPDKSEEETYKYMCDILNKTTEIKLEYDDNSKETDSYGRRYAWVFVDDLLLQDILVKEGYVNISSQVADYKYMDDLKTSLNEAKDNEKGIWKVEEENFVEEQVEEKPKKKSIWKQITTSIVSFIDGILDSILKFIESML